MIGAILGDIIGSRWEFNPTNDYNFELLSPRNGFTDDTICTIAVADALLHGSDDFGLYIHQWCRRYPHPMGGYGGRFAQWVASDNPQPYGSFGNGSAMRVSPLAHWYSDRDSVLRAAEQTAACSHNHPEGIKGAQTVALAIHLALQYNQSSYLSAASHIDQIIDECVRFSSYDINMPKSSVLNRFDETCQGTVPVALRIISMSTCYEDAVRQAVSLGADADTLGAIVGSIAEAIWGIPLKLRSHIDDYLPDDMMSVIGQFHSQRPFSFKSLIDTKYSGDDFSESSYDLLYDIEGKDELQRIISKTQQNNEAERQLLLQRAQKRYDW